MLEMILTTTKFFSSVTTLALGSWRRQGLTKVWVKSEAGTHISYSQECGRVWGNEPSHFQVSSHLGSWSLDRFSNIQRAISGVKTH